MLLRLILLIVLVPLVEITLLVWLTRVTNFWVTLATVVGTGILGASLARRQGVRAWRQVQTELAAGRMPAGAVLESVLILLAGTLLITPGLLTDCCGFVLLIPPLRRRVGRVLLAWLTRRATVRFQTFAQGMRTPPRPPESDPMIIDAEFTREHPDARDDDTKHLP